MTLLTFSVLHILVGKPLNKTEEKEVIPVLRCLCQITRNDERIVSLALSHYSAFECFLAIQNWRTCSFYEYGFVQTA